MTSPSVDVDVAAVKFVTSISSKLPLNVPVDGVINVPLFNSVTVCGPAVTSNGDEHDPTGTLTGLAAVPMVTAPVTTKWKIRFERSFAADTGSCCSLQISIVPVVPPRSALS